MESFAITLYCSTYYVYGKTSSKRNFVRSKFPEIRISEPHLKNIFRVYSAPSINFQLNFERTRNRQSPICQNLKWTEQAWAYIRPRIISSKFFQVEDFGSHRRDVLSYRRSLLVARRRRRWRLTSPRIHGATTRSDVGSNLLRSPVPIVPPTTGSNM